MADTTRYQLRLKGPASALLDDMCRQLDASPKDVILDALAVMHFAMESVSKGLEVGSYDSREKTFTAVVTPSLQNLKNSAPRAKAATARAYQLTK